LRSQHEPDAMRPALPEAPVPLPEGCDDCWQLLRLVRGQSNQATPNRQPERAPVVHCTSEMA
jgi:hypothetical protein